MASNRSVTFAVVISSRICQGSIPTTTIILRKAPRIGKCSNDDVPTSPFDSTLLIQMLSYSLSVLKDDLYIWWSEQDDVVQKRKQGVWRSPPTLVGGYYGPNRSWGRWEWG